MDSDGRQNGPKKRQFSPEFLARMGNPPPNPGGRPKGIRSRIAALTDDGDKILQLWADAAFKGELCDGSSVRPRERLEAARELALRLWGKPVETTIMIDGTKEGAPGLAADPEALAAFARALLPSATVVQRVPETIDAEPVAVPITQEPDNTDS